MTNQRESGGHIRTAEERLAENELHKEANPRPLAVGGDTTKFERGADPIPIVETKKVTALEYVNTLIDHQTQKVLSIQEQIKQVERQGLLMSGAKVEAQQHLEQLHAHRNALVAGEPIPPLPVMEGRK